jgi:hypothetical protein
MIEDCCRAKTSDPIIVFGEKGRFARFDNTAREQHTKYAVDGCIVKNQTAADFAVTLDGVGLVIVELKGKDVERGTQQVMESAELLCQHDKHLHGGRVAGLIVARRLPCGASTTLQKQQEKFRRRFRGRLTFSCGEKTHEIRRLLGVS